MPISPAAAAEFNRLGGGLVHMEIFVATTACACYSELLVAAENEIIWAGDDIIMVIVPLI